jgi:hypothetical protein
MGPFANPRVTRLFSLRAMVGRVPWRISVGGKGGFQWTEDKVQEVADVAADSTGLFALDRWRLPRLAVERSSLLRWLSALLSLWSKKGTSWDALTLYS